MKSVRDWCGLGMLLLMATPGCATRNAENREAAASPSATPSPPPISSAVPPRAPRLNPLRGGFAWTVLHAAHELPLSNAQKATLESVEQKAGAANPASEGAAFRAFQVDLVAGIRAGTFDAARMQDHFAAVDQVVHARDVQNAEALNGLHEALDPAQCKALTAWIRAKEGLRPPPPDVPSQAQTELNQRVLDGMTSELSLDPAQQRSVATILANTAGQLATPAAHREAAHQHLEALLVAFEQNAFDAKTLDLSTHLSDKPPHEPMQREVNFLTAVLPILSPEQRERLATKRRGRPSPPVSNPARPSPQP